MSTTVDELVSACFDELKLSQRFVPYVQRAEEAGYRYRVYCHPVASYLESLIWYAF